MFKNIKNYFKDKTFFEILPWIWMIASYCLTFIIIYFKGKYYIDSDMASEMVLADLLNKDKALIFGNWYYSSEIRIFYLQLIYRLTLLLFPNNWYLARVIGQAIWMFLLLLSYFFVCGKNGLNLKNKGVIGAACLVSPFGLRYFSYVALGGFYIPHMILFLISLGLVIRIYREDGRNVVCGIMLLVVSFLNSLGSVKGIMALYAPLCLTTAFMLCYRIHVNQNQIPKKEIKLLILSIIVIFISCIGYKINTSILSNKYTFARFDQRTWTELDLTTLLKSISGFLSLFGYPRPEYWTGLNVKLFSINGILGLFSFVIIAFLIISIFILIKNYSELSFDGKFIISLFISSIIVQAIIFSFTKGTVITVGSTYWLTSIPLAFIVIVLALENFDFQFNYGKLIISYVLMISVTFTSISSVYTYFSVSFLTSPSLKNVYKFLVDNEYTQGYSTFWNGNVLTEWSSGEIEVWSCGFNKDNFLEIENWLQTKEHKYLKPENKFFILTNKEELTNDKSCNILRYANVVYEDDNGYIVMLFNDFDELNDIALKAGITLSTQ